MITDDENDELLLDIELDGDISDAELDLDLQT